MFIMDNLETLHSLATVELPWNDNKVRSSCIPEGTYTVNRREGSDSRNFKYTHYHVTNVPDREWILFHIANYTRDLLGCIGPGKHHKDIDKDGIKDVTNSADALRIMLDTLGDSFELIIIS